MDVIEVAYVSSASPDPVMLMNISEAWIWSLQVWNGKGAWEIAMANGKTFPLTIANLGYFCFQAFFVSPVVHVDGPL